MNVIVVGIWLVWLSLRTKTMAEWKPKVCCYMWPPKRKDQSVTNHIEKPHKEVNETIFSWLSFGLFSYFLYGSGHRDAFHHLLCLSFAFSFVFKLKPLLKYKYLYLLTQQVFFLRCSAVDFLSSTLYQKRSICMSFDIHLNVIRTFG